MGSCNQEIDASAGSLVWVRRQNGSWWPGRVVGLDEIPASLAKLPGARTPIRLLGREDGSMDWYNLEKSKRVKAFRCGEYDEIIQKAKDNARRANRRSIDERKYVRREDAILHALELEKVRYFDENYKLGSPVSNSITTADKNFGLQSAKSCKKAFYVARAPSSFEKSRQELTQSVVSIEHPDKCTASDMHSMKKKRRGRPNDSEDDATEGMKLTRDLEGLGLGMVIKCEPDVSLQTKGSSDLYLPDNASLSESNFDNDFSGVSPMNSSKDSTLTLKRKRSQVIQACENMRKKTHSLSLEKVFMGSTKTDSISIYHHDDVGGQSILQGVKNKLRDQNSTLQKPDFPSVVDDSSDSSDTSCEDNLFDTNENNCSAAMGCSYIHLGTKANQYPRKQQLFGNDFSGGFIDVPVVMEMENASDLSPSSGPCSAATLIPCAEKEQSNHCIQVGVVSQINEGLGDTCSTGSATHVNHVGQPIDMSASEWYSKGKRNFRYPSLSKNVDLLESFVNRYTQSDSCFVNRIEKDIMGSNSDESPTSDSSRQLTKCMLLSEVGDVPGDRKYKTSSMHDRKHDVASQNCHAYSAEALNACNSVPYAQENGELLPSEGLLGTVMPLRAPLPNRHIRLPSRYRDSQQQVSTGPHLYDVELNVQTSYQGNRVPLVSLSSKLNGKAIVGHPITVDVLEDGLSHTSNINDLLKEKCSKSHTKIKHVGPKKKLSGAAKVRSPLSLRKSNHGKKLGISPRKIRRLSSLVVDKKEDRRRWVVEKIGGPAVSCIPLRLVFSRLNEALSNSRH